MSYLFYWDQKLMLSTLGDRDRKQAKQEQPDDSRTGTRESAS